MIEQGRSYSKKMKEAELSFKVCSVMVIAIIIGLFF